MNMKVIHLSPKTDEKLSEISRHRKESGEAVSTKRAVIAELVDAQYRKELKQ